MVVNCKPNSASFYICRVKSIRQIFEDYIAEKGITKSSLAKKFGVTQQAFQKKISKNHFSSDFIYELSKHLEHDFFSDLSIQFNKTESIDIVSILSSPSKPLTPIENEQYWENRIINLIKENITKVVDNSEDKNYLRKQIEQLKKENEEIKAYFEENKRLKKIDSATYLQNQSIMNEPEINYKSSKKK